MSHAGGQCPDCRSTVAPGDANCPECGVRLDGQEAPHPAAAPVAAPAPIARVHEGALPTLPGDRSERPPSNKRYGQSQRGQPPPVDAAPRSALPDLPRYRAQLSQVFGFPNLREGQERVLAALGEGDVLAVMPTGSGKSLCFVLPALEVGRTVVVSPLIALMQDQVESLRASGVAATFINSNLDRDEQNRRYHSFVSGRTPLLYVAPERFTNAGFTAGLARSGVELFAIDEAHCISEWGHNFRPDYLLLGEIRERLGRPRTLALTATANPQVRRDIAHRLGIDATALQVVTTVDRPNLTFRVVPLSDSREREQWLVEYVRGQEGGSGIVYARTRRGVEELADVLTRAGIGAAPYHAGLGARVRTRAQREFTVGTTPVIVATNAFGMGVDKPNVRFVVHVNMPGRIESYYQEAGRAGRDGEPAECTLLYLRRDRAAQQRFIDGAHPTADALRATWQRWLTLADPRSGRLPYASSERDPDSFALTVAALRSSGLLDPVAFRVESRDPSAPIDLSGIEQHRLYAEARLREMAEYAETDGCRRGLILRYFGEEPPEQCDACDRCLGTASDLHEDYPEDLYEDLVQMRDRIARESNRDPYRVFENRTARELAEQRPERPEALLQVWGIGETRANWLGAEILSIVSRWNETHPDATPPRRPGPTVARLPRPPGDGLEAGVDPADPLVEALRSWRSSRARADGAPAYTLFSDRTLRDLVATRPTSRHTLLQIWGLGESRVERFGHELLEVIRSH